MSNEYRDELQERRKKQGAAKRLKGIAGRRVVREQEAAQATQPKPKPVGQIPHGSNLAGLASPSQALMGDAPPVKPKDAAPAQVPQRTQKQKVEAAKGRRTALLGALEGDRDFTIAREAEARRVGVDVVEKERMAQAQSDALVRGMDEGRFTPTGQPIAKKTVSGKDAMASRLMNMASVLRIRGDEAGATKLENKAIALVGGVPVGEGMAEHMATFSMQDPEEQNVIATAMGYGNPEALRKASLKWTENERMNFATEVGKSLERKNVRRSSLDKQADQLKADQTALRAERKSIMDELSNRQMQYTEMFKALMGGQNAREVKGEDREAYKKMLGKIGDEIKNLRDDLKRLDFTNRDQAFSLGIARLYETEAQAKHRRAKDLELREIRHLSRFRAKQNLDRPPASSTLSQDQVNANLAVLGNEVDSVVAAHVGDGDAKPDAQPTVQPGSTRSGRTQEELQAEINLTEENAMRARRGMPPRRVVRRVNRGGRGQTGPTHFPLGR